MESFRLARIDIWLAVSSRREPKSSWKTGLNALRFDPCVTGPYSLLSCFWLAVKRPRTLMFRDGYRRRRRSPSPCERTSNIRILYRRLQEFPGALTKGIGL